MLKWFRGERRQTTVIEMIRTKDYQRAITQIREHLVNEPNDYHARLQLGDTLALCERKAEAVTVLDQLADDYAAEGFIAKAIAVLKRIQKLDPSHPGIGARLQGLTAEKSTISRLEAYKDDIDDGLEDMGFEEIGFEPIDVLSFDDTGPGPPGPPLLGPPPGPPSSPPGPPAPLPILEDPPASAPPEKIELHHLDLFSSDSGIIEAPPSSDRPVAWTAIGETPLFKDFHNQELTAIISGMELREFNEGESVVREGQPGDSLFIITTGTVAVTTAGPGGGTIQLATLREGEFFGEVSVLTGKPRTATITALEGVEALELNRENFEIIEVTYPRVRQVLQSFYETRAEQTVEAMIKAMK